MAINFGGVVAGIDEEWTRQITRREKREDKELDRVASLNDAKTLADYRYDLTVKETNRQKRMKTEEWAETTAAKLKELGYTDTLIARHIKNKPNAERAIKIGEENLKTGLFNSPDVYYTQFNGNNNIKTEANEVPHEGYQLNRDKYSSLFNPVAEDFSTLSARLTHFVGKEANATTTKDKEDSQREIKNTLEKITAEAKAKKINDGEDIFSQAGAQSRVVFALSQARGSIEGVSVGISGNIKEKLAGKEGEQIAIDLKAVKMIRDMHGRSSPNLNKIVDSIETETMYNLRKYGRKLIKTYDTETNSGQLPESLKDQTVKNFYKVEVPEVSGEGSWSIVSKKMQANQYRAGDVIQYIDMVEEKNELGNIIKTPKKRHIIFTGVPMKQLNGSMRSWIVGG